MTRVIVGHRLFFYSVRQIRRSFTRGTPSLSLPPLVRFRGEADMIRQAKPAELVENDPDRKSGTKQWSARTVVASNRAVCYTRWLLWFFEQNVDRNRRGRFPLCDYFKSHLQPREGLIISHVRSTSITGRPGRGAAPVEISAKKVQGSQMSGSVTAQSLIRGAVYSLEHCGVLLGDAKVLYENGSYATALAVGAFAREELGRWRVLLKLRKQVLDGASLSVEDIREACNDHVRKQESGMTSLTMRADNKSGLGKLLQDLSLIHI